MNGNKTRKSGQPREDYTPFLLLGTVLAVLMALGFAIYALGDPPRLAAAAAHLHEERVSRGEVAYGEQCAACHGAAGEGGVGPALNNRTLLKNTPDDIFFSVIRSGVPNTQMPSWSVEFGGPLTDEDIRDLVAFIRAWEATAPEVVQTPRQPDPAQGALLFSSTCALCHGENGAGGKPGIPAINNIERLEKFDNEWYRQVIANGRPARGMPTWGTVISPAQIDDLVALVSAWREGKTVVPAYSVTELIERALFALSQKDIASARLHVSRAVQVTTGPGLEYLKQVDSRLEAGEAAEGQKLLTNLKEQWPIGNLASGAELYQAECAACHGSRGEGGIGTALNPNEFVQKQTNSELIQLILEGRAGTAMAGFNERLSEAEIADIIALLRSWQEKD